MSGNGTEGDNGVVHIVTEELESCASRSEDYLVTICQLGATITMNLATVANDLPNAVATLNGSLIPKLNYSINTSKVTEPVDSLDSFTTSYSTFSTEVVTTLLDLGDAAATVDPENGTVFDSILSFLNSSNATWVIAAIGQFGYDYFTKRKGSNSAFSTLYARISDYVDKGATATANYADGHYGDGFYRNGSWAVKIKELFEHISGDQFYTLEGFEKIKVGTVGTGIITAILYLYSDYINDGSINDLVGCGVQTATAMACYFSWGAITSAAASVGGPVILLGALVAIGATWVISSVGNEIKNALTGNYEIGNTGIYKNGTGKETWDYYTKKYRHDDLLWDMITGNDPERWYVDNMTSVTPKTYKNLMYSDWRNVVDENDYDAETAAKLDALYENIKNAGSYDEAVALYNAACDEDSFVRLALNDYIPFDVDECYYYSHQDEYYSKIAAENAETTPVETPTTPSKESIAAYNSSLSNLDEALDTYLEDYSCYDNNTWENFESSINNINGYIDTVRADENYDDTYNRIISFEEFLGLRGYETDYKKFYESNPSLALQLFRDYCDNIETNVEETQLNMA